MPRPRGESQRGGSARGRLDDVRGDVRDLLLAQLVLERGHRAAAVRDPPRPRARRRAWRRRGSGRRCPTIRLPAACGSRRSRPTRIPARPSPRRPRGWRRRSFPRSSSPRGEFPRRSRESVRSPRRRHSPASPKDTARSESSSAAERRIVAESNPARRSKSRESAIAIAAPIPSTSEGVSLTTSETARPARKASRTHPGAP